jgi:uncharacterized membrane protein
MSGNKAAITVILPREAVEQRWQSFGYEGEATVSFRDAPGDRGTEVYLEVDAPGKLGGIAGKLKGSDPRAKAMDDLRRFKQLVETGEIARSEGTPEGEAAERKLKQRPAQPLDDSELEKAGVS